MSSNEEYLDSLLKALLGNESSTEEEQAEQQDSAEEMDPGDSDVSKASQIDSSAKESNKAMSTDEIEEMLASMGGGIVTNAFEAAEQPTFSEDGLERESVERDVTENFPFGINDLSEEQKAEEIPELENWDLDEGLPEEANPEEISEPDNWSLDDILLPEESESDIWALEEELLPEESEEIPEPDGWSLDGNLSFEESESGGETESRGAAASNDWTLEEELLPEKAEVEREAASNDWAMEEELLPEEAEVKREAASNDWALKEELLPEETEPEGETASNDWALEEELLPEEAEVEREAASNNWALEEELLPENVEVEGTAAVDDWDLEEELLPEKAEPKDAPASESGQQSGLEDWRLEVDSLSERLEEETVTEDRETLSDFGTEEEEFETGVSGSEEAARTDLEMDASADSTMSEEEVDRLLGDDFALEESGEADEGLSELLESMGHDEDLSEINDLLEKADRGVTEDEDMMALLGNPLAIEEEENNDAFDFWGQDDMNDIPEQKAEESIPRDHDEEASGKKEKKKKEKKGRKAGKKNMKGTAEEGKAGEEQTKKQGFFARLLEALLEDEDDFPEKDTDNAYGGGSELGSLTEENAELLAELNAEDKKNSSKKDKKKKAPKKKDKKDKKPKKAQKPKKPKKEKKVSAEENGVPEKGISRTKIIFVCLFCASVAACIIVVDMFMPDHMQKQEAKEMYEEGRYEETYGLLYGKELNEEEAALLQKSNIILQIKRKLQSYETYNKLEMQAEALSALIEGVERYQMFRMDAEQYGVANEVDSLYTQILSALSENYGLSEEEALDIIASDSDLIYSEKIYGIINGTGMESPEGAEEEQTKIKQDVLPEEEEIIDRLENPEVSE